MAEWNFASHGLQVGSVNKLHDNNKFDNKINEVLYNKFYTINIHKSPLFTFLNLTDTLFSFSILYYIKISPFNHKLISKLKVNKSKYLRHVSLYLCAIEINNLRPLVTRIANFILLAISESSRVAVRVQRISMVSHDLTEIDRQGILG